MVVGTIAFMAPEQLDGREVDQRADIWAFGCVLYEMLTGRRAFEGPTPAAVIAAILERDPPAPSAIAPSTPPALDRVVRKMSGTGSRRPVAERRRSARRAALDRRRR
jgi:serine/threonine protein kinase